jgi:peroxiredoxin
VIAVAIDDAPADKIRRFADARKATFPIIHDSTARVVRAFKTVGVPESYLVSDGRIVWHRAGEIGPAVASLRKFLR